ncbi:hypothetical protein BDV96DRAFT_634484 [Lophiotrema nucula]|uniref:Uncharacterized protein n=1 Tax=Lophiotrema nucula TaxID=690887 RepID=A0A6A5YX85_9PLEO|nr:hypothetical protein BDV96DRAFT_634484 [Lophiotrema nucula]
MTVLSKLLAPLAVGLLPLAQAANEVLIRNHCSYPLYFWIVRPGVHTPDDKVITVPARTDFHHGMEDTGNGNGGIALKFRDVPFYEVAPAGILQVEYKFAAPNFWYDLSRINCDISLGPSDPSYCPFIAGGVQLVSTEPAQGRCPVAWCTGTHCVSTYETHGFWNGEPTFNCPVGNDIVFDVCTNGDAPVTFGGGKGEEWKPPSPPTGPPVGPSVPVPASGQLYTYEQCFALVNGTGLH